jgi:hypothetical protein
MYTPFFKFLIIFILVLIIYLIFNNLNEHFTTRNTSNKYINYPTPVATLELIDNNNISLFI